MDDQLLIKQLCTGNGDALKELMLRHEAALKSFLIGIVRNETLAEELCQEAFTKLYFNASKYVPKSSVKTFLFTIARNLAYDHFRKHKLEHHVSLDSIPDLPAEEPVEAEERISLLKRAITALPESLRKPIELVYFKELSYKEASLELKQTPKQIDLAIQKGKKLLKDSF
jgi:RNA polymerase sigma factor (sigma-70 family)